MNDLIEKLSNLRSHYNCFDEDERDAYSTLSEAIKVISERQEPCEDTVSRQAAIDVIDAVFPVDPMKSEYAQGIACGAALAKTYVEQLPSAQPEPQWIPCSERLPQPNEEDADGFIKAYLVQDSRWMDVARWNGDCWIAWGYGTALTNVIAWMPLPEPYAERRTDETD